MYKPVQRLAVQQSELVLAEISIKISLKGRAIHKEYGWVEFESSECDQKENLLKVRSMKKQDKMIKS